MSRFRGQPETFTKVIGGHAGHWWALEVDDDGGPFLLCKPRGRDEDSPPPHPSTIADPDARYLEWGEVDEAAYEERAEYERVTGELTEQLLRAETETTTTTGGDDG